MSKWLEMLQNPRAMPVVGISAACFLWLFDATVDHFAFNADAPFVESLWPDSPQELWMRVLVACLFIGFTLYARMLLNNETRARQALAAYQSELEATIAARTRELQDNYRALQEEMTQRQHTQAKLELLATTDPLTRLYNRRKFDELLGHELERCRRHACDFALILFDVDHFKRVNDQHGHDVGDAVLEFFADIVRAQLRKSDVVARWGGEEFIALVPDADADTALAIADKLRRAVQAGQFPRQQKVSISMGISLSRRTDNAASLIKRADQALYQAKQEGRNRVILETPEEV